MEFKVKYQTLKGVLSEHTNPEKWVKDRRRPCAAKFLLTDFEIPNETSDEMVLKP